MINKLIEDEKYSNTIKCVFSDECMEYIDGSKAVEILKYLEINKKIKKVYYISNTCYDDEDTRQYILDKGVDFILNKPCSINSIESVLQDINLI